MLANLSSSDSTSTNLYSSTASSLSSSFSSAPSPSPLLRVQWKCLGWEQEKQDLEEKQELERVAIVSVSSLFADGDQSDEDLSAIVEGCEEAILLLDSPIGAHAHQNDIAHDISPLPSWQLLRLFRAWALCDVHVRVVLVCPDSLPASLPAGLSKSMCLELPDLPCQRVWLPLAFFSNPQLIITKRALRLVRAYPSERDLKVTSHNAGGQVFAERALSVPLTPIIPVSNASSASVVSAAPRVLGKGKYIVTGGTGGIGAVLVQWLIEVQRVPAVDVVLISRRAYTHPLGATVLHVNTSSGSIIIITITQLALQKAHSQPSTFTHLQASWIAKRCGAVAAYLPLGSRAE
jgi:hypothetical protein